MRLFYAINFPDYVKETLNENLDELKKHIIRGNFTAKQNFHATLLFIGECEVSQLGALREITDAAAKKVTASPVKAKIEGLSSFARVGEELVWAGLSTEPYGICDEISKNLLTETEKHDIIVKDEGKKFVPHVTLARKAEFWRMTSKDLYKLKFEPVSFNINTITLMESTQEKMLSPDGEVMRMKLVYKPLYESRF